MKAKSNLCLPDPNGNIHWLYEEGYLTSGDRQIIGICNGEFLAFEYIGYSREEQEELESIWRNHAGLTGTGFYGEYRDLVFILEIISERIGGEIEIPDSLAQKLEEEDQKSPLKLNVGDVW